MILINESKKGFYWQALGWFTVQNVGDGNMRLGMDRMRGRSELQTTNAAQSYEDTAIGRKMSSSVSVLITVIEIEISRREYPVSLHWEKCPFLARAHFN